MPKLSCTVYSCSHNDEGCCALPAIDVSGGERIAHTHCQSYTAAPLLSDNTASPAWETGICCSAKDCMHNDHCACTADSVRVCRCRDPLADRHENGNTECESYRRAIHPTPRDTGWD